MGGGSKGGGSTVNQVSGLADSQFSSLSGGQQTIRGDISNLSNQASQGMNNLGNDMSTGFNNVTNTVNGLGSRIDDVDNTLNTSLNTVSNTLERNTGQLNTKFDTLGSDMGEGFANLNTNLGQTAKDLGGQMTTGFAGMGSALDRGVSTILQNDTQNFGDTNANMAKGFAATNQNVSQGFADQGDKINSGFAATGSNINDLRSQTLSGQVDIKALVEKYGGNLDRYYADLAASQTDQTQRMGTLQTDLDRFQTDSKQAQQLSSQQQERLASTVTGGFNAVNDTMSRAQSNDALNSGRVQNQVRGLAAQVGGDGAGPTADFSRVAKELAVGFNDGTPQSFNMRNDFINRLNAVRMAASDPNVQVDPATRQTYTDIASSFDQGGRLIPRSADQQGNQVARALDNQGNLLLAGLDPGGNPVRQQAYNLNQAMSALDKFGYRPQTSPVTAGAGIAAPYASTF